MIVCEHKPFAFFAGFLEDAVVVGGATAATCGLGFILLNQNNI